MILILTMTLSGLLRLIRSKVLISIFAKMFSGKVNVVKRLCVTGVLFAFAQVLNLLAETSAFCMFNR